MDTVAQSIEQVLLEQLFAEQPEGQRVEEPTLVEAATAESSDSLSARRVTRSQTGRVTKRKTPTEPSGDCKKRATSSNKKQRGSSTHASVTDDDEHAAAPASASNPMLPIISPPEEEPEVSPTSRITFLEISTAADAQLDRRISRSRAVFPVPVPNLTKKSRGRRVPTTDNIEAAAAPQPEKRVYICKVDGCGKCFHRGEHLKRHIRSIHTHEKPFKCSYPQCGKFFNRHDNLLQHLKVHKETKTGRGSKAASNASDPGTPPPSRPPSQMRELESPGSETQGSPTLARPRTIYDHQPNLYAGYVNTGPFESPAENMRFVTNMAVSSLRTELPQSPTEHHAVVPPPPFVWHRPDNVMQDQLTY